MSRELTEYFREMIDNNRFAAHNHVVMTDIDTDRAEGYIELQADSTNAFGNIHGGSYFVLADSLAGMAARSNKHLYVTQNANAHFLGTTKDRRINGVSRVLKRTRNTCLVESRVTDESGKLIFLATFTFFNVDGRLRIKSDEEAEAERPRS